LPGLEQVRMKGPLCYLRCGAWLLRPHQHHSLPAAHGGRCGSHGGSLDYARIAGIPGNRLLPPPGLRSAPALPLHGPAAPVAGHLVPPMIIPGLPWSILIPCDILFLSVYPPFLINWSFYRVGYADFFFHHFRDTSNWFPLHATEKVHKMAFCARNSHQVW